MNYYIFPIFYDLLIRSEDMEFLPQIQNTTQSLLSYSIQLLPIRSRFDSLPDIGSDLPIPNFFIQKRSAEVFLFLFLFFKIHRKATVPESLQASACSFIKKETLAQVFSSEFYEISKKSFFTEHLRATASIHSNILVPQCQTCG